jgi:hypothetical protein
MYCGMRYKYSLCKKKNHPAIVRFGKLIIHYKIFQDKFDKTTQLLID